MHLFAKEKHFSQATLFTYTFVLQIRQLLRISEASEELTHQGDYRSSHEQSLRSEILCFHFSIHYFFSIAQLGLASVFLLNVKWDMNFSARFATYVSARGTGRNICSTTAFR